MRDIGSVVTGLVAVAFGGILILWVIPAQTVPAIFAAVPSGFYPTFTSGMLILSGLALAVGGLLVREPAEPGNPARVTAVRFVAAFVLLVSMMYLTPLIGFVPAGVAICLVTLLLMREHRWFRVAVICIAIPLLIWGAFEILLGRPLP